MHNHPNLTHGLLSIHTFIMSPSFITLLSSVRSFMWAPRIEPRADSSMKSALAVASHGYILGAHMNECTLLNNVMLGQ